ncbi:MAG: VanZ family protein [Carnobacterium sp.]
MLNRSMKQVISWAAVLFWMGLIFYLSSQPASQSFDLSQEMIYVTIQVVKFSQVLMCVVLGYAIIKIIKQKQIKIDLKKGVIILLVLVFFYSLSTVLLRYFAPVDLHHFVRKNAHFFIYLVLGFLTTIAFKSNGTSGWKSSILALILCVSYAFSDELHQTIVPGREAMLSDVGIDSLGVSVGIMIQGVLTKVKRVVDHKRLAET